VFISFIPFSFHSQLCLLFWVHFWIHFITIGDLFFKFSYAGSTDNVSLTGEVAAMILRVLTSEVAAMIFSNSEFVCSYLIVAFRFMLCLGDLHLTITSLVADTGLKFKSSGTSQ
jgi:hypothetical protein